jgi:hypothetical protein
MMKTMSDKETPASPPQPCLATFNGLRQHSRPAFEKLLIGPLMIFGQEVTGGNYLEVLTLSKQMSVGKNFGPTYWKLHTLLVAETGFVGAFYRGFYPWGLIQCVKGVPVLFVQHEATYQLTHNDWCSQHTAEQLSGFMGGTVQAIFVCPLQKIKVAVVASQDLNNMTALQASANIVMKQGVFSLFDGIFPMMLRRSLDWGIRFGASSEIKNRIVASKRANGEVSPNVNGFELIGCGLVGGAFSASTHPIDNVITNSQKPLPFGTHRDVVAVIRRMATESGVHAFTRGWGIKVIDNAYHTAWMYGVGTILYDYMQQALQRPVYI